ncbi:hypothetical protein [Streptomyces sp. NPDC127098]|uniref:hypothetical protein n=1 Tax=Streptomyces sp. NPDC127098 TaxID=3347137 RepID=UPI00366A4CD8
MSALLLALVYMHGVSAEGVLAHLAPGSSTPVVCDGQTEQAAAEDTTERPREGHGSYQSADSCAAGQPQSGPGLAQPGPAVTDRAPLPPPDAFPTALGDRPRPAGPAAGSAVTAILRI